MINEQKRKKREVTGEQSFEARVLGEEQWKKKRIRSFDSK
jgi:hypothetical protein